MLAARSHLKTTTREKGSSSTVVRRCLTEATDSVVTVLSSLHSPTALLVRHGTLDFSPAVEATHIMATRKVNDTTSRCVDGAPVRLSAEHRAWELQIYKSPRAAAWTLLFCIYSYKKSPPEHRLQRYGRTTTNPRQHFDSYARSTGVSRHHHDLSAPPSTPTPSRGF